TYLDLLLLLWKAIIPFEGGVLRARGVVLNGGRCWKGFGYKVVTKGCLKALMLKGGDGGAWNLLGRLLDDVIEVFEVLGC
ncbi:hypothetical protein Tco_0330618, partial [Tanacetum coccineum]